MIIDGVISVRGRVKRNNAIDLLLQLYYIREDKKDVFRDAVKYDRVARIYKEYRNEVLPSFNEDKERGDDVYSEMEKKFNEIMKEIKKKKDKE